MSPRKCRCQLGLEPWSSRWWLQRHFRLSVTRTCTPYRLV